MCKACVFTCFCTSVSRHVCSGRRSRGRLGGWGSLEGFSLPLLWLQQLLLLLLLLSLPILLLLS